MWQFFLSSWRSGFRGRSFLAIFVLGVLLVGVAYLSASFSPRQPRTVALDVGLSGLRFCLALFAITLVQELVGREVDRRSVVLTLSYPLHRAHYILGRFLGIVTLSGVAALALGLLLWTAVLLSGLHYDQPFPVDLGVPYWIAIVGIWVDVAVIASFVLWIASLSTVPMLPLILGVAFAIAGKALGAVAEYLASGADGDAQLVSQFSGVFDIVRWVLPDLSRLDWRAWPMYGSPPDTSALGLSLVIALLYIALMLWFAVAKFSSRDFS